MSRVTRYAYPDAPAKVTPLPEDTYWGNISESADHCRNETTYHREDYQESGTVVCPRNCPALGGKNCTAKPTMVGPRKPNRLSST